MPGPLTLEQLNPENPLVLVGGGHMGSALLSGWLDHGLALDSVWVVEPFEEAQQSLRKDYPDIQVVSGADQVGGVPVVIVLAVKPQIMDEVLPKVTHFEKALVISIAAGKPLAYFEQGLGDTKSIIRVMPNTPASVGAGISVACANNRVNQGQKELCAALLNAVGETAWIKDEGQMDAVTALSGSGPAYVFLLTECLANAGVAAGLPPDIAAHLARHTVIGSGLLMRESDDTAETLRRNVTSPGGTTHAALEVLMAENGLQRLMTKAIEAARDRSIELSG